MTPPLSFMASYAMRAPRYTDFMLVSTVLSQTFSGVSMMLYWG